MKLMALAAGTSDTKPDLRRKRQRTRRWRWQPWDGLRVFRPGFGFGKFMQNSSGTGDNPSTILALPSPLLTLRRISRALTTFF